LRTHPAPHRSQLVALSVFFLFFFLPGCAILKPDARPSDPLQALRYDITQILSDSIFVPSQASIKVVSLDTKEVLFEHNSKLLMRPASNMKLLTSSSALGILGLQHQFKTVVYAELNEENRSVCGKLYLKGFGDPDLTPADLDSLAAQVQRQGLTAVCHSIVADVSYHDDLYWGYGWNWDDEPFSYAAFISPLSVNDNCVDITVSPADSAGKPVLITSTPRTSYITVQNSATTTSDSATRPLRITRLYKERLNTIIVEGQLMRGDGPVQRKLSVWKPELYAATLLQEALQRRGIFVAGKPQVGATSASARELASLSRNIVPVLTNLNKISDNLSAEMFLKTISAEVDKAPGSSEGGVYAIHRFLSTFGIDTTRYQLADGSGLSFYNLITTEMIIQLLQGMTRNQKIFPAFVESLPVAGVDGTLRSRMRQTPAQGNLRAKTGTINGVSTLSGYVTTLDGEKLAFSMAMQNFTWPTRLYTRAQDKIGALLAGFSRQGRAASARP
jgi:D-alanyl-D-alanine carboxypeptidase/D-alanyl-D-alanine-endopeptidase (penicillin-binding protein 4)